jgi:hypothetical protein
MTPKSEFRKRKQIGELWDIFISDHPEKIYQKLNKYSGSHDRSFKEILKELEWI